MRAAAEPQEEEQEVEQEEEQRRREGSRMSSLDESNLEKKFENVTNSQESIQSLSLWILHHKSHHKRIVQIWLQVLERAKASHRLTLLYLANDVIQHAKKRNVTQYLDDFAEVLKEATVLIRDVGDDKIRHSSERVFAIWMDRGVYSPDFVEELKALVTGASVWEMATSKIVAEFKLSSIVEPIKRVKKVEANVRLKLDAVNCTKVDTLKSEVLNQLKDKSHGEQYSKDFDDTTKMLETAINAIEKEIAARTELLESLEKSQIFYENQNAEARMVAAAYKNFGFRVNHVKKQISSSKSLLPSPMPSPSLDAPSPTNSDDGPQLPGGDVPLTTGITRGSSPGSGRQKTSLDQRLSSLMQSIPGAIAAPNSSRSGGDFGSSATGIVLPLALRDALQFPANDWSDQSHQQSGHRQPAANFFLQHPPPPPPPPPVPFSSASRDLYPYGFKYSSLNEAYAEDQNSNNVQPIQAVISSRSESLADKIEPMPSQPLSQTLSQSSLSHFAGIPYNVQTSQPHENFEPADMDLGNSDEEEVNRSQTQSQQRVLKVIDTRRAPDLSNDFTSMGSSEPKVNGPNNDLGYSNAGMNSNHRHPHHHHQPHNTQMTSHLKSSPPRFPVRAGSMHSNQGEEESSRWAPPVRTPRSVVTTSPYPSQGSFNPSPHPQQPHQNQNQNQGRNWHQNQHQHQNQSQNSPRNSRRGNFARRY